jgi:flavin-dependent dehydrogenase
LRDATRVGPWLAAGPLRPGIRVDSNDGIFRIGNAAGEAHPIIGEGMSMALQSAWLLSALLLTRPSHSGLANLTWQRDIAARYAAQWRQQFAPRLRLAKIFAQLAMRPLTASAVLWVAKCWPGLLTLGARLSGKTRSAIAPGAIGMMPALLPANAALESPARDAAFAESSTLTH